MGHDAWSGTVIRSWLTFAREVESLQERLEGLHVEEAWTQERNRLHLSFSESDVTAEFSVDLQLGYGIVVPGFRRARRNAIDLFEVLAGRRVSGVSMIGSERAMRVLFHGEFELDVVFFGPGAGNIHLRRGGEIIESYREPREGEVFPGQISEVEGPNSREEYVSEIRHGDQELRQSLSRVLPLAGKRLIDEAIHRCRLDPKQPTRSVVDESIVSLLEEIDDLWNQATTADTFYVYTGGPAETPLFSLVPLQVLPGPMKRHEHDSIDAAIRQFRSIYFRTRRFKSLYTRLDGRLGKEVNRLERLVENTPAAEVHLSRADRMEMLANLLLSNLSSIERGVKSVRLASWVDGELISIELDPKLGGVENAERYFKKARGARKEAKVSAERVREAELRLEELRVLTTMLESASDVDELETIESRGGSLFEMKGKSAEAGSAERFRHFRVEEGLDVYAGKNARNNDELTLRFANPSDYWFHARGSSGSHVVLRWSDRTNRPPKRAIEQAAQIAAYYSGARGAKLVPVAFTQKKYVRKPKGAAPGSVTIAREEVVMVSPELP